MIEEKRIYVVVAGTVQVPAPRRSVVQPSGRQYAQGCHATSKLRIEKQIWYKSASDGRPLFYPITTIIKQARDSAELTHVQFLLRKKKLEPVSFFDTNTEAYGPNDIETAFAVLATKEQIENILDYLPLWDS